MVGTSEFGQVGLFDTEPAVTPPVLVVRCPCCLGVAGANFGKLGKTGVCSTCAAFHTWKPK